MKCLIQGRPSHEPGGDFGRHAGELPAGERTPLNRADNRLDESRAVVRLDWRGRADNRVKVSIGEGEWRHRGTQLPAGASDEKPGSGGRVNSVVSTVHSGTLARTPTDRKSGIKVTLKKATVATFTPVTQGRALATCWRASCPFNNPASAAASSSFSRMALHTYQLANAAHHGG
jgi:hypothetical protein